MKTVEITLDEETGEIMVGLRPEDADADGMMSDGHLEPAEDIEEALETARTLLTGDMEEEGEQMAEEDMMSGFQKVRKPKPMMDEEEAY